MSDTEKTEQTTPTDEQASLPDTSQGQQSNNEGQSEATFTQADVDRIVSERAKRASESAINKFIESLGLSSPDEAKTFIEAERKRKESEMSELEKAQAEIEKANQLAQEAIKARDTLQAQVVATGRKQAFMSAIGNSGGRNAEDLFILVNAKHGEDFVSVFDDTNTPNEAKMSAFVKQVQSSFPSYFGTASAGSPSNSGGVAPSNADFTDEAMKAWQNQLRS